MLISIFKTFIRILFTLIKGQKHGEFFMKFWYSNNLRTFFFFAYHCHGIFFGDKIGEQNDSFKVEGAKKEGTYSFYHFLCMLFL